MQSSLPYVRLSENKRFLQKEDGTPFFWLADTAWELFHKLDRDDAAFYLKNRAENGFTVIQAVALSEFDGIRTCNAYGRKPLLANEKGEFDPSMPDTSDKEEYDYWRHVDYIIETAADMGLYIALLPTWGDKYNNVRGMGPKVFTSDNALIYGKWIGSRYKNYANVFWVLGGDRHITTREHFEIVCSMAQGIREGDEGKHLITFHPAGNTSSSFHMHDEHWLDFNMLQSGHYKQNIDNYSMIKADYERLPVKPVVDGEPSYEDHPIGFNAVNGYFDAADVRRAAYWALFSGAFGHTYGHHSVWSMCTEPSDYVIMKWKEALNRNGAMQMKYLRQLLETRSFFDRVPAQDVLVHNYEGANHLQAARGRDYLLVYDPNGLKVSINLGIIQGTKLKASWYDPRNGHYTDIGTYINEGTADFTPPSSGRGDDWVLVIDAA